MIFPQSIRFMSRHVRAISLNALSSRLGSVKTCIYKVSKCEGSQQSVRRCWGAGGTAAVSGCNLAENVIIGQHAVIASMLL